MPDRSPSPRKDDDKGADDKKSEKRTSKKEENGGDKKRRSRSRSKSRDRKRRSRSRSRSRSPPRRRGRSGSRGRGGDQGEREPNKVFVGNLDFRTRERDLEDEFGKYGKIQDIYIPLDRERQEPRGFAFITFHDSRDAEDSVKGMDGKTLDGRAVQVNIARARPALGGGGGGGGGGRYERGGGGGGGGRGVDAPCRDFQRGTCKRDPCRFLHEGGGGGGGGRSRSRDRSSGRGRSRERRRSRSRD